MSATADCTISALVTAAEGPPDSGGAAIRSLNHTHGADMASFGSIEVM